MRSAQGWLILGVGAALGCALLVFFNSDTQSIAVLRAKNDAGLGAHSSTPQTGTQKNVSLQKKIDVMIKDEAFKIGQVVSDPEGVEQSLNTWAQSLTADDVTQLRHLIFNQQNVSGDEIALSLDLLGRSRDKAAEAILVDYILRGPHVATAEKETFQLLALEGLIDQSMLSKDPAALKKVMAQTEDAFLAQRTAQGLKALEGHAPTPAETDQRTLAEMLNRK